MDQTTIQIVREAAHDHSHLIIIGILAGIISFGLTEVAKPVFTKLKQKLPKWHTSAVRAFALAVGAVTGACLLEWPLGAAVGTSGGILSVWIVRGIKRWIKNATTK